METGERLQRAVQALVDIPFDDHVAEGPRAKAKRVLSNSRCTAFPFAASTLRLDCNLSTVRELLELPYKVVMEKNIYILYNFKMVKLVGISKSCTYLPTKVNVTA